MKIKTSLFFIFLLSVFLKAEIQFSQRGYFDIGTIHRLTDGSIIKIPYRMLTYEPTISHENFYLIISTAMEFRLKVIEIIPNDWDDFWEKAHVSHDFIFSRDLNGVSLRSGDDYT